MHDLEVQLYLILSYSVILYGARSWLSTIMNKEKRKQADRLYLLLAALFIAALVTCNLIANKFISIDLGFKTFIISAGILPYPITFLITDILSEIYGRKKTNAVVLSGVAASLFVLLII